MGDVFLEVKNYIKFLSLKKSSILSGGLVFFVLIGIIPLAYLSSLILTFLGSEMTTIMDFISYSELQVVMEYISATAVKLGAKGNILAFLVALYSAGNIFYQLRLSGEIIYNCRSTNNLIMRIFSIIITFIMITIYSIIGVVFVAIMPIAIKSLGMIISGVISGFFAFLLVFSMAILINFHTCPYKLKIYQVLWGSLYTAIFTFLMTGLFFIYINYFANYNEIYGKVAIIIVFLSWLYLMIKGFIGGITLNVYFITKKKIDL